MIFELMGSAQRREVVVPRRLTCKLVDRVVNDLTDLAIAALGPELAQMLTPKKPKARTTAQPAAVARPRVVPAALPPKGQSADKPKPGPAAGPMTAAEAARALGVTPNRIYQLDDQLKPNIQASNSGTRFFKTYNPAVIKAYAAQRESPPPALTKPRRARKESADREPGDESYEPDPADERRARIARVAARRQPPPSGRPPELGVGPRRGALPTDIPKVEEEQDDEIERWPAGRIAVETRHAEASKHVGELPEPRSSFGVTHGATGGLADVEEYGR